MTLQVTPVYSREANCFSYLACDPRTRCCAVINPLAGTVDAVNAMIEAGGFICEWVLATGDASVNRQAAYELARHHLCARTAGPAGNGFDVTVADDQTIRVGHLHGRVVLDSGCASYVFDGTIFAGCCESAHSTVGRDDPLNKLTDDCKVLLHHPLQDDAPMSSYRRTLGELRSSPPMLF
ncbi:MAG: hypothetical protein H6993_01850 [Pseudomonadales bacterium]|nr:hypothetical protein [Pseudomonadales bacterium]